MQKLSCILLVDDDPTTNFLHEQLLLSLGVTDHCLVAENGEQALALLAEAGESLVPALVLLDVHMPVMGGVEFLEAYVHPHDRSRLAELSVTNWVTKPLTREKVNGLLQQHFQRQLPPEVLEENS
jgi:CheY-like chemotaxis protein